MVPCNDELVARIMDRVVVDDNGCWLWQGKPTSAGHGQIWCEGRSWGTHRIIYAYYHGKIDDGLMVLHSCDVPNCCNPDHLEAGTRSKNVIDAVIRIGRKNIILTNESIEKISLLYMNGLSGITIAKQFGVGRSTIYKALDNKNITRRPPGRPRGAAGT